MDPLRPPMEGVGLLANSVALVNGKPIWAANRKHTAEENAQYQFTKNGADFGASNETEYVRKVHAFLDHPPAGVETLDRSNGDKLLYDPKANIFAVVSRDGAPRTMFKPRDGAAYWDEQKTRMDKGSTADRELRKKPGLTLSAGRRNCDHQTHASMAARPDMNARRLFSPGRLPSERPSVSRV